MRTREALRWRFRWLGLTCILTQGAHKQNAHRPHIIAGLFDRPLCVVIEIEVADMRRLGELIKIARQTACPEAGQHLGQQRAIRHPVPGFSLRALLATNDFTSCTCQRRTLAGLRYSNLPAP